MKYFIFSLHYFNVFLFISLRYLDDLSWPCGILMALLVKNKVVLTCYIILWHKEVLHKSMAGHHFNVG